MSDQVRIVPAVSIDFDTVGEVIGDGSVDKVIERNCKRFVVRVAVHVGHANGHAVSRVCFVVQQRTIGDRDLPCARVDRERTGDCLRLNRVGQRLVASSTSSASHSTT